MPTKTVKAYIENTKKLQELNAAPLHNVHKMDELLGVMDVQWYAFTVEDINYLDTLKIGDPDRMVEASTPDQSVVTCVYCGMEYPRGTPTAKAKDLTDHIKVCTKHPMRQAENSVKEANERIDRMRARIKDLEQALKTALTLDTMSFSQKDAIDPNSMMQEFIKLLAPERIVEPPELRHKLRHVELHKMLDELVADYIKHVRELPSRTILLEFMKWSHEQTFNPTHKEE